MFDLLEALEKLNEYSIVVNLNLTGSSNDDQHSQGRRCLFKSGPAEEIIECRRHKRGSY